MNSAIDFYYQFRFMAVKIGNEKTIIFISFIPNRILPDNFRSCNATTTGNFPESCFCFCFILPESPADFPNTFFQLIPLPRFILLQPLRIFQYYFILSKRSKGNFFIFLSHPLMFLLFELATKRRTAR